MKLLRKWSKAAAQIYEEVVLTSQVFVIDGETRISKVLENAAGDVGAPVELTGFARFELGEVLTRARAILRLRLRRRSATLSNFVSPTNGIAPDFMALIRQRSSA